MALDVTEIVRRYRLCLRHLWNCEFWPNPEYRNFDFLDLFRALKLPVFKAVVADALSIECETIFGDGFSVVPSTPAGFSAMLVSRDIPDWRGGIVWEELKPPSNREELQLTLIDIEDFSPFGYIDLKQYRAVIAHFPSDPGKVGHHVYVLVSEALILWSESEPLAPIDEKGSAV